MKTSTVNIAFRTDLLKQIDEAAREESRSRSELIREAARLYIDRKRRWSALFQAADAAVRNAGASEADVARELKAVRRKRARAHRRVP